MTTLSAFRNFKDGLQQQEQAPINNQTKNMTREIATFGPVHLNVTKLQRSVIFWTGGAFKHRVASIYGIV